MPSKLVILQTAIAEAKRFIKKAEAAVARLNEDDGCYGTKEMGAVKRAALDLGRECTNVNQMKQF